MKMNLKKITNLSEIKNSITQQKSLVNTKINFLVWLT